ncbi:MAG: cytidylate kinase-like family protein [Calditrichaeota bacterium]|nr:cytidylate kinase-like family protein [Calditrichota bacterium]
MKRIAHDVPLEHLVSKQIGLWEVRRRIQEKYGKEAETGEPWQKAYITISREVGSKGNEIAQKLAEILGWQVFDKEIVDYIAATSHIRKSVIESFDEKKQHEIKTWVQTIIDSDALNPDHYLNHLMNVLFVIAEHGQAIILGRGANFILDPKKGLRVKIAAPYEMRLVQIMHERGFSRKEARRYIEEKDNQRLAYIRQHFHKDADNPLFYDLVLNTEFMSISSVAETIVTALKSKLNRIESD